MLPDDRLRDLLRTEEDRARADPVFLDELYDRLAIERRRRRSVWARLAIAWQPFAAPAGALVAVLALVIVGSIYIRTTSDPASTPAASASQGDQPSSTALPSRSPEPSPSLRDLGIAFKEYPDWLVPTDGVAEASSSTADGLWTQTWLIPRAPEDVIGDFQSRLLNQGIFLAPDPDVEVTMARSQGVTPSIVGVVAATGNGTLLSVTFDLRGGSRP